MMLKRLFMVGLVLFVLSFFFLTTWQGYRYERLRAEVRALERQQKDWLESNKKAIAGVAVLSSPGRIAALAESDLRLKKLEPGQWNKVRFASGEESSGE